jgi:peptidoglycan/LPS O-acetylase OafA/YrhL
MRAIANPLETTRFRFVGRIWLSAYLWHFPVMLLLGCARSTTSWSNLL